MSRTLRFIIFFAIALSLYGLLNSYIFIRGIQSLPSDAIRPFFAAAYLFLSLSYIAGRLLERVSLSWFSSALVWIGSFWLGAMVYFYVAAFTIDLLRLSNHLFHFFPRWANQDSARTTAALVVCAGVALTVLAGHVNARLPRLRTLEIAIPKNSHAMKTLTVAMASDIHLGTIISKSRLERIVEKINLMDADLVLLPGDVLDEDLGPVIRHNLGETLRKIRSKFGVVAITGNHEYIGGVEPASRYLTEHGILVLRDGWIKVNDSIYVVGREDLSISQFGMGKRKALADIMAEVDKSFPVILMDHQPFRLHEAVSNGVDIQLSGHTHHGQLWPFNFITRKVYELSWGYMKKSNTHFYVSCGVGTWGPPVRIGSRPEIMKIVIHFG